MIDDDVGLAVLREVNDTGPLVAVEIDTLQVRVDDLVEHSLVVANDDELASASRFGGVALLLSVVVEHLSTVGEQRAGLEDMLDPQLITKAIEGRPDSLERYARSTNSGEHVALRETDERDGDPAVDGTVVMMGSPTTGDRP